MAGTATIRRIAGDIQEIAFLVTAGTLLRGHGRADGKVALATSPISQVTLRADIPGEFAGSGIAAKVTFPLLFLGRHKSRLPFSLSLCRSSANSPLILDVLGPRLKGNHLKRRNKI